MSRSSVFESKFREDLAWWIEKDRRVAIKVMDLVRDVMRDPFAGLGKPEPLKGIADTWSRRVTQEHRMVYVVEKDRITFTHARYHY